MHTAKVKAILKATEYTTNNVESKNVLIFSDSLSCLTSIQNQLNLTNNAWKIQNEHFTAQLFGKHVLNMWFSGHCSIVG